MNYHQLTVYAERNPFGDRWRDTYAKKKCRRNIAIEQTNNEFSPVFGFSSNLPLDAIHRYEPISLLDNFDSFNTSPPKDVTVEKGKKIDLDDCISLVDMNYLVVWCPSYLLK